MLLWILGKCGFLTITNNEYAIYLRWAFILLFQCITVGNDLTATNTPLLRLLLLLLQLLLPLLPLLFLLLPLLMLITIPILILVLHRYAFRCSHEVCIWRPVITQIFIYFSIKNYQQRHGNHVRDAERRTFLGDCTSFERKLLESQQVMEVRGKVTAYKKNRTCSSPQSPYGSRRIES